MQHHNRLLVAALVVAGLQLSACQQRSAKANPEHPATVERKEGSELSRITLSERAIERIGLKTDQVREEHRARPWIVGGEVVASPVAEPTDRSRVWVRVRLGEDDLKRVDRTKPARVLPASRDGAGAGLTAQLVVAPKEPAEALQFVVNTPGHGFILGQHVRVELPTSRGKTKRQIVPYSALIYDPKGHTWVYTSPQPRTFTRHKVVVEYIQGDEAVLKDGPAAGTVVASVGVAELYGTEFKVGH